MTEDIISNWQVATALFAYVAIVTKIIDSYGKQCVELAREKNKLEKQLVELKSQQQPQQIPHLDYEDGYGCRNHIYEEIELACSIVTKNQSDLLPLEDVYAGHIFTDLADTEFFEQMMEQNADLKDSIEASMRKFMAANMKQEPCRRFYVPNEIMEKYMTTNEY